ncbi:protein DpdG [Pseudomonas viridiflava]|jgi:hypothetical protein|uniref:protein DpdG n=1 Tax=Pseudomonas viridiflava TaxID=33069 RepID=UPI000F01FA79|nr:protein DpdG [Pseudomonas viridiflava]
MSLLNITNDGLPNVLAVLHARVLASKNAIHRDELLEAVAPEGVVKDEGKQVRQTLRRWTELGLFIETENMISVLDRPSKVSTGVLQTLAFTRRIACKYALSDENNQEFWAAEGARAADLTRTLAWMMAQDAFRTRFGDLERLESEQIENSDRRLMQNSTRKTGVGYWAEFLGFSRQPGGDIDPTVAVRDVLPEILGPGEGMSARDFVDRIAEQLPVLDGGRWQTAVLAEVSESALAPLQSGQVSTALSRALLCLRATGELLLQNRADTGSSIVLSGFQGIRPDLTFQWFSRPSVEA